MVGGMPGVVWWKGFIAMPVRRTSDGRWRYRVVVDLPSGKQIRISGCAPRHNNNKDAAKQAETMQFWEIGQNRSGTVASGEVTGPWGPRRVIAEMPAVRASGPRIGTFGNYAVLPFYKGGWYFSRGGTHKVAAGPLTVRMIIDLMDLYFFEFLDEYSKLYHPLS